MDQNGTDNVVHRTDGPAVTLTDGSEYWYKNGERHRDNDLPAILAADGSQQWYRDGNLHRDAAPTIITTTEQKCYHKGALHHIDQNYQEWFFKGKLHRTDGPAVIGTIDSGVHFEEWYLHGKRHRDNDQPADVSPTSQGWYKNGWCHRDGATRKFRLAETNFGLNKVVNTVLVDLLKLLYSNPVNAHPNTTCTDRALLLLTGNC